MVDKPYRQNMFGENDISIQDIADDNYEQSDRFN